MRDILTPQQAAEFLQLSTEMIYRLIRSNQLAATRIGRSYRILREDLDTFLITHSNRPEVREALFARVNAIAERNPSVSSDDVLEELEREDAERKRRRAS